MISYQEAVSQAQSIYPYPKTDVRLKIKWVAYKNGAVAGESTISKQDAIDKFGTDLVERVPINLDEYDQIASEKRKFSAIAYDIWFRALQEEYRDISLSVFNLCFDEAWDRSAADGYDAVAASMEEVVVFAEKILETTKNGK